MDCPECDGETVAFPVDDDLREYLPGNEAGAAICTRCLRLHPVGDPPDEPGSFERLGDAFPDDPDAAVPMALLVGLLSSLALYRSEISSLLGIVEREGVDPLLAIDRLSDAEGVESHLDLGRRRHQLEQLIE